MTTQLLIRLYENVKTKELNLTELFEAEDIRENNTVKSYTFEDILYSINEGITDKEFLLLKRYIKKPGEDDDEDEELYNYRDFIRDVEAVERYQKGLDEILTLVFNQLDIGKPNLFMDFEKKDQRRRKLIDLSDVQEGFDKLDINLSENERMQTLKFHYYEKETKKFRYVKLLDDFKAYLSNINRDYEEFIREEEEEDDAETATLTGRHHQAGEDDLSDEAFKQFFRFFNQKRVLNPKAYFKKYHDMDDQGLVHNYEFKDLLEEIFVFKANDKTFNQRQEKKIEALMKRLRDKSTGKISIEEFVKVYNNSRDQYDVEELDNVVEEEQEKSSSEDTRLLHSLLKAVRKKNNSYKDYFKRYGLHRERNIISVDNFYVACEEIDQDLGKIEYDDLVKFFRSDPKSKTLSLAALDTFAKLYDTNIPFYISSRENRRQKEFLKDLIHYAYEIRRAEKVSKLMMEEDRDKTGVMDIRDFLAAMSFLDLGIKRKQDQYLLWDKYGTEDEESLNILTFCYDYELVLIDLYPRAFSVLQGKKPRMRELVERIAGVILDNYDTFDKWFQTFKTAKNGFKIRLDNLMLKLREEMPDLSLKDLVCLVEELDREKRGFVLDFKLKDYFSDYTEERAHPIVLRLVDILKKREETLEDYTRPSLSQPGVINFDRFCGQLKRENYEAEDGHDLRISEQEFRELLNYFNMEKSAIELVQLQLKLKNECLNHEVLTELEIDRVILGKTAKAQDDALEAGVLSSIIESTVKAVKARKQTFEQYFGKKDVMFLNIFRVRMEAIGVASHSKFADLVQKLENKEKFNTVDLGKFKAMYQQIEDKMDKEYASGKDATELIRQVKEMFSEGYVNLGGVFKRYDEDDSNNISIREFYLLVTDLAQNLQRRDVRAMFDHIDSNKSGKISKTEFEKAFGISLRDKMSSKVEKLSWASPILSEIAYTLRMQSRTVRDYFRESLRNGKISLDSFRVFLSDLELKSLENDNGNQRRKLENALKDDDDRRSQELNFYLLKAAVDEFEDPEKESALYGDETMAVLGRIVKHFDYDVDKICYAFDYEEDGVVTKYEFLAVCKSILPSKIYKKGGDVDVVRLEEEKRKIATAYSFLSKDDADAKEVKVEDFREGIQRFIEQSKMIAIKDLLKFIFDYWVEILEECESYDKNENNTKVEKGYIQRETFIRVLELQEYKISRKEMITMERAFPIYVKRDRVYYKELMSEIRKSQKKSEGFDRKNREKGFQEILEGIKRRLDYDQGNLIDELISLEPDEDNLVPMEEVMEILEEIAGKLTKEIKEQIYDRLLTMADDDVDYRKVVTLIFTGKTSRDLMFQALDHRIVAEFAEELLAEMQLRQTPSHDFFKFFARKGGSDISLDELIQESTEMGLGYSDYEIKEIYEEILENYAVLEKKFTLTVFRSVIFGYRLKDIRPLVNKIRAELAYRRKSAQKMFKEIEKSEKRALNFDEFYEGLKRLSNEFSFVDIDILFAYFDRDQSGSISLSEFTQHLSSKSQFNEFAHLVELYLQTRGYQPAFLVSLCTSSEDKTHLNLNQFYELSKEVCGDTFKRTELKSIFEEIDQSGDGLVSVEEFEYLFNKDSGPGFDMDLGRFKLAILEDLNKTKQGLKDFYNQYASIKVDHRVSKKKSKKSMGIMQEKIWDLGDLRQCLTYYEMAGLKEEQVQSLFKLLDYDNDKVINFQEFKRAILGHKSNLKSLIVTLRRKVKRDKIDIKKIGKSIDLDGDRQVAFKEFFKFLEQLDLNFTYKDAFALFEEADADHSGFVSYQEMLGLFDDRGVRKEKNRNNMVVLREDLASCQNWGEAFAEQDISDKGLTPTSFIKFLRDIKSRLERFEGYDVFAKLDYKKKGRLTLYDLEEFLEDSKPSKFNVNNQQAFHDKKLINKNKENLELLRDNMEAAKVDLQGICNNLDFDKKGIIAKRTFEKVLTKNKLLRSRGKVVRQLIHFYQKPHTILIQYRRIFEDMGNLKPRLPNTGIFLAEDILAYAKVNKQDLKQFFESEEAKVGDFDGKLRIDEFGKMVEKVWQESKILKLDLETRKPIDEDFEKRKEDYTGIVITRPKDEPSKQEIRKLFNYLKIVPITDEGGRVQRTGDEEQLTNDITFFEFLRLFPKKKRQQELDYIFKDFKHIINNIKLSLIQSNNSVWSYLQKNDEKRHFILKTKNMNFVKDNALSTEINKFADKLEQPSRKGFISIPLLVTLIDDLEIADGELLKKSMISKREGGPGGKDQPKTLVESIMKSRKKEKVIIGQREFSEADVKSIRRTVKDLNEIIAEDEEWKGFYDPFEEIDEGKTGFVNEKDFKDIIFLDIGIDDKDEKVKKAVQLTYDFASSDNPEKGADYRKLKDLMDGKLDEQMDFEIKGEELKRLQEEEERVENEKKERLKDVRNFVKAHFKQNKVNGEEAMKKYSKDGKTVDEEKLRKGLLKDVSGVDEEGLSMLMDDLKKKTKEKQDRLGSAVPEAESGEISKNVMVRELGLDRKVNITPVKFDGDFDEQVDQVFKLVDINQNGAINKQELRLGCKKLGLNLSPDDVDGLFDSFKRSDGAKTLDKEEFSNLISYKFRSDLVKPGTVLEALKGEIDAVDVYRTGFLTKDQISNLYQRMNLNITNNEIEGLIEEIGDEDGEVIAEDKFVKLIVGKDQKFKNTHVAKAVVKLRGVYSPSLGELVNSFTKMPDNFFLSFSEDLFLQGLNLPSEDLEPKLSKSQVYFTNVLPPLKPAKPRPRSMDDKEREYLRRSGDNLLVEIELKRAKGIPYPSDEILQHAVITRRCLRIMVLRKSEYLGSILEIPCRFNPSYQDRWYFDSLEKIETEIGVQSNLKRQKKIFGGTREGNLVIFKKGDYKPNNDTELEIVFEFVVFIKRKKSRYEIAMSNGYAKAKLRDLTKKRSFSLEVSGGNPANFDLPINPEDIRKERKGFMACFCSMFEGKVTPILEFGCKEVTDKATKDMVLLLPNTALLTKPNLPICKLFRQCLGFEAFRFPGVSDLDLGSRPFVKTFLRVYNIFTVRDEFAKFFNANMLLKLKELDFKYRFEFFRTGMQKLFLMLEDPNFHFSKVFPTMNYHDSPAIQMKRLKLCRRYFRLMFRDFARLVQKYEKIAYGDVRFDKKDPIFVGNMNELKSEVIPPSLKAAKVAPVERKPKAFDIRQLLDDDDDEDDGFSNVHFG